MGRRAHRQGLTAADLAGGRASSPSPDECGRPRASGGGRPVIVIGGPTASGKSTLALAAAREFGGVVINADSMQVYRELPILTAQPSTADRQAAPHRLYGFLSAVEACSAGIWAGHARREIEAAHATGRLPIVVGGTGLYLRAATSELAPIPSIPPEVRRGVAERLAAIGNAAFHAELTMLDPAMAGRLRPSDRQRLIRAREVIEATGRSLADWQRQPAASADRPNCRYIGIILAPPRDVLYAACDARFLVMVEKGAIEEARRLWDMDLDPGRPAMKAVGVRELIGHVEGRLSLAAAAAAAQQATRRYAKRQMTWFRHQRINGNIITQECRNSHLTESFLREIVNIIRRSI